MPNTTKHPKRQLFYATLVVVALACSVIALQHMLPAQDQDNAPLQWNSILYLFILINLCFIIAGIYYLSYFCTYPYLPLHCCTVRTIRFAPVDFLGLIGLYLVLSLLFSKFIPLIFEEMYHDVAGISSMTITYILMLAYVYILIKQRGGNPWFELGLKCRNIAQLIRLGIAAFLFHRPLMIIVTALSLGLCQAINVTPEQNPIVDIYTQQSTFGLKLIVLAVPIIVAPLFEEIFFRGVLYRTLRKNLNSSLTILFTALIFSALHAGLYQMMNIFILGLILGYLKEKTGSLIPSITLHFLLNFTSMIAMLLGLGS